MAYQWGGQDGQSPGIPDYPECTGAQFFAGETLRDLDFWPFNLDQLSYIAGHVINTAKKLEDPMPILSWVMSYYVFHWLLLEMRFRLLRMRRRPITWPVHTRLTALCPGLPRWSGTRKIKPIWILLKQETVSGSGMSWAICKSAPRSRQITNPCQHPTAQFFTGRMPFLPPNQQHQSTEGILRDLCVGGKFCQHFWNHQSDLPIHYETSVALRLR